MTDFPTAPLVANDIVGVSQSSWWGTGPAMLTGLAGTAWPATNDALFIPFRVPAPVTVYKMACGTGTLTTENFDLGIYDAFGNRLVSSGSTAKTTASSERVVDITDTQLLPGLYYLAMAVDGVTQYQGAAVANIGFCKLMGMRRMATAFPLPATATLATCNSTMVPMICAYFRSE